MEYTSSGHFSSHFSSFSLRNTKVPTFLENIATLHQQSISRGNITFSLSFMSMPSRRFKFNLLEHLKHPIITDSFDRENIFSYFCTISKERHHFTSSRIKFSSFICIIRKFSIILDYSLSTSSYIIIKLDFNEKSLISKTLIPSTPESLSYESFSTEHFRISSILF